MARYSQAVDDAFKNAESVSISLDDAKEHQEYQRKLRDEMIRELGIPGVRVLRPSTGSTQPGAVESAMALLRNSDDSKQ